MFVASSLYSYATSRDASKSPQPSKNNKVKRRSRAHPRPLSPPPSYESIALQADHAQAGTDAHRRNPQDLSEETKLKLKVLDSIIEQEDLYKVLDVRKNAKPEEIRRAFLNRSRICHPDKFPSYPASTIAFQKVAFAYETLSKPSSRRVYDISGRTDFAAALNTADDGTSASGLGEETLNNVLYSIMCEFLDGDFDMIRVLVQAMNDGSSGIQVGTETVESLEGAFKRVRELLLAGKRYVRVVHLEILRLYEIQQNLRSLSYFDVFGRLRLTLQLARVTLSIPMAIDHAMKAPEAQQDDHTEREQADSFSSSEDADSDQEVSKSVDESAGQDLFGIASEDAGSDSKEDGDVSRSRSRRRAARAREAARRQNLEADSTRSDTGTALQHRGLLGPTASRLLKGVIKVLETSEAWVPGQSHSADREG